MLELLFLTRSQCAVFQFFLGGVLVLERQRTCQMAQSTDHLLTTLARVGISFANGPVAFRIAAQEQALDFTGWRSAQ